MSKKDIAIALLLNLIWGTSFTFANYAILMIFSAIFAGLGNIAVRTIKNTNNKQMVLWLLLFMGVGLFIVSLFAEQQFIIQKLNWQSIIVITYLGIVSSYFTYIILYYLLIKYETSQIMSYNFLRPIVSAVFGFLLLAKPITCRKIFGVGLILFNIFISQIKFKSNNFIANFYKKSKQKIKSKFMFNFMMES